VAAPSAGDEKSSRDPRESFAELSRIMLGAQPLSETLGRVAELAKQTIPGAAEVSVTLMHEGKPSSVVFTGPLASHLDERQYQAGFGPCTDAAISGETITIDDTSADTAYPDFGRLAWRSGVTHTMSIGLPVERQTIGGMNVYGIGGSPFDEPTKELARAFAGYAAVAVANAGLYASVTTLAGNLQRALESRGVIDQAKGILMGRGGITADAAFQLLAKQSQVSQRKLHDVAADLVREVSGDVQGERGSGRPQE
jgi:GAF domain-containing protein